MSFAWWSRHLMRCDCLCCVMSRDAVRCHGDELLSVVPDDSRIIRTESDHKIIISHPPLRRPYSSDLGDDFVLITLPAPAISQNVTKCCTCHENSLSTFTKYCACHKNSHSTFTTYCASHGKCTLLFSTLFSWHLFSKHLFSKHLFSLGIYSLRIYPLWASIFSWHLFSLCIYSLACLKTS